MTSLGLVSKFEPGLGLGLRGYSLDYITDNVPLNRRLAPFHLFSEVLA